MGKSCSKTSKQQDPDKEPYRLAVSRTSSPQRKPKDDDDSTDMTEQFEVRINSEDFMNGPLQYHISLIATTSALWSWGERVQ